MSSADLSLLLALPSSQPDYVAATKRSNDASRALADLKASNILDWIAGETRRQADFPHLVSPLLFSHHLFPLTWAELILLFFLLLAVRPPLLLSSPFSSHSPLLSPLRSLEVTPAEVKELGTVKTDFENKKAKDLKNGRIRKNACIDRKRAAAGKSKPDPKKFPRQDE